MANDERPAVAGSRTEVNDSLVLTRFLVFCAVAYLLLLVLPVGAKGPWYLVFAWVCTGLVVAHQRHQAPQVRAISRIIILTGACSLTGAMVRGVQSILTGVDYPFPSVADVFAIAAYPLFLAAIVTIVRRRVGRITLDLVLDAAVAGLAAALVQWQLILIPYLRSTDDSSGAIAMNIVYATLSTLLVMAAVLALVAGGHRSTSNRLLAAGLLSTVALDVVATLITADRLPESVRLYVAPFVFIFGGAGLLHPSVYQLMQRPSDPTQLRRLTNKRIGVLALALLTAPVLLVVGVGLTFDTEVWLPAVASLALAPLVVTRLGQLVRANEAMAAVEATLRSVGERLVGAESTEDVQRVITVGAEQVLGRDFVSGGLVLDPLEAEAGRLAFDAGPVIAALRVRVDQIDRPRTGELVDLGGESGQRWVAGLVISQRQLRGALALVVAQELTADQRNALTALCREASIALRAVEQTELNVRQRSEERFAALVDNSSDIVAVLGTNGRLSYVSPVAVRLLGYPPDTYRDLDVLELVHPEDRDAARTLLEDVRFGNRESRELRLRHVTGTFHWFEVVGVDLESDPNIGGIVLNAREIGDRKAAEVRLQLSEARFKNLVQHSSDLVLVVDSHDGIRYLSPSVAKVVGEPAENILGRPLEAVFRDCDVDWQTALRRAAGRDGEHPELLEFGFRNSAGDWVHVETAVTDLRAEPAVSGWVLNARDVTERTTMTHRLRYQATHDDLTGLANRVLATEELAAMLSRNGGGSTVAVISVDLDDFKDVNESLGHGSGDELLRAVAERITGSLVFGDVAARTGGDEFVIVCERPHGEDRVMELAQSLLSSLEQPFSVHGRPLRVTASAGVAFDHDRSSSAEVLLRNADTAMYRAKQQGKRQAVVFEAHMHTESSDRLELRADLALALETDQFMSYYQPIIDLETHQVVGAEALIRWQHPVRGLLSPAIFVPLAEESGLIGQLGEWMLDRACRDLAAWRREMPALAENLTMSVNLSAQEVHSERLVPVVTDVLHRSGLPADRLVLEVTESNLLTDTDVIQERMRRLRSLGTRLAIDDFGTGYSSLGYIQRFAFDILKVDRSFVEGLEHIRNRQIVTAVLDLARELGVRVVAEGIEQEAQERTLVELGCSYGQGFLYSRPVPSTEFRKLLASQHSRIG